MNRIIGVILVLIGIISGVYAFTRHTEEKTILDIGNVEIKNENKKPGEQTMIYYIISAIGIIGGASILVSKSRRP